MSPLETTFLAEPSQDVGGIEVIVESSNIRELHFKERFNGGSVHG